MKNAIEIFYNVIISVIILSNFIGLTLDILFGATLLGLSVAILTPFLVTILGFTLLMIVRH